MAIANAPGLWRWEKRGLYWWRHHDELNIDDGPHREPLLKLADVLEAVSFDEARTVMDVARVLAGEHAWLLRTNVRNRLYILVHNGDVICDDGRPMKFARPVL